MTTSASSRIVQVPAPRSWTTVRCPYCNKPAVDVIAPTAVRTRCSDRGCKMWIELTIG